MSSLRKEVKKRIKKKCPSLLEKEKKPFEYISDKYWALLVFPLYLILYFFSIYFKSPECLNYIEIEKPQELNNSSNSILASIVGITMVIIGFIFTEIKSKAFIDFKFFSERTFIFPIFYSSLANISGMFCISVLSKTLPIGNAVILSHYMILLNILLIVVIFIKVSKYMDYKPVFESYRNMMLKKANSVLLQEKIVKMFDDRITNILTENDIVVPYGFGAIDTPQKSILNSKNSTGLLYDVNIKLFEKTISLIKTSNPLASFQYARFLIGKNISENTPILQTDVDNAIAPMSLKLFKTKLISEENDNEKIYKSHLENIHDQYLDAVRNNKHSQVLDYLTIYKDLNKLYMDTNAKLK